MINAAHKTPEYKLSHSSPNNETLKISPNMILPNINSPFEFEHIAEYSDYVPKSLEVHSKEEMLQFM